jgi:hypothetical protein
MVLVIIVVALSAVNSAILSGAMTDESTALAGRIKRATSGLVYQSETDAPVAPYRVDGLTDDALTPEVLLERLGREPSTPVATVEFDEFFADLAADQDWYGDEERDMAKRYRRLVRVLKRALADLKVYKVGEREIEIYVLGRTPAGEYLGVTTKAVET